MRRRRSSPRPIHLLEFGLRWPPETFIAAKLERLAARGIQITVACADARPRPLAMSGVRIEPVIPAGRTSPASLLAAVVRLAVMRPRRVGAVVRAARAPTGVGRRVGRREALGRLRAYARLAYLRPDIVHFEWNTAALHFYSLPDALGCPSVVSLRGGDLEIYAHGPATRQMAMGYPAAIRRAATVHCVSDAAREAALVHGLRHEKARVIRPAVDPAFFTPNGKPRSEGSFRVVAAGWLHWRKGWEYALQAIALLAADGVPVRLEIAGPEPAPDMSAASDLDRIRHAIDDLGLSDTVTLHGQLEHTEVRTLLQEADALLHSSLAEGIPNVVLEAMACGLPVVATDVGGTSEVLADGVEGYLIPPRDSRAAAAALAALWRDPERRRALGRAGRARVEAELTLDRQTDRWVELYEEVAAGAASPARPFRLVEVGLDWPPEAFLRRKLQALAERGTDVAVASTLPRRARPRRIAGIRLKRLPHWTEPRRRALLGMVVDVTALLLTDRLRLRSLVGARRALMPKPRGSERWRVLRLHLHLARLQTDVAHFEWTSFASRCSPLFDVWDFPVVVSCHGSEVLSAQSPEPAVDLTSLFGRVDAVHCVSRAVARAAAAQGLDGGRAHVIPSAVDPNVFRPPRRERPSQGEFVVVTVGALRRIKGHEYALRGIAQLAEAGVPIRYEIAGSEPRDPAERGELRRILTVAEDLGLADRFRPCGQLSEPEVVSLLQRADAFLQTSLSEGMPTAVLEAMACGLPVVATDVGGTREVLTDGVEGSLVPPGDPRGAAAALELLWRDPERRREMGRAGRARVEAELTLERQLDQFESLYRTLATP